MAMPSSARWLALAALGLFAGGCAAQLGGGVGVATPVQGDTDFRWSGKHQAALVPPPGGSSTVLGYELEGAATPEDGSRWSFGLLGGYGWAPEPRSGDSGWELHADLGSQYLDGGLLKDGNFHAGLTGSWLIYIGGTRDAAALNDSVRLVKPVPTLVLSLQPRATRLPHCDDECWRVGAMLQVAVRVGLVTDILP
ncbi:MAG: hypothetical protein OXT09_27025 [Myxococcales bacterium]|nr:hypothetical protein [Myxococcales bacterium]